MSLLRTVLGLTLCAGLSVGAPASAAAQEAEAADSIEAARTAAEAWLQLVDEADYSASWETAASLFKAAVTQSQWEAAVLQARGPLEPFGDRSFLGAQYATSLPNAPDGEYVVIQYETAVANGGTVVETVTPMRDTDGTWRVSGYYVRPQ